MTERMLLVIVSVALSAQSVSAAVCAYSRNETSYEGTQTCLACHEKEARSFFHSQHYQWRGETPGLVNADGKKYGKMNTINDFCTNPKANWIGKSLNSRGEVVAKGCSKCHAGLGKLPEEKISQEQLENIDCLICHVSGYRRDLYENEDGTHEWKPILWQNKEGMDIISKRISLPTRKMCLRCHAASGGGKNWKRGDIEYHLADCAPSYDVHMSADGADMHCVDCHAGGDHRVRGRGVDLAATDRPDKPLSCSSGDCHGSEPHDAKVLNHHAKRVACESCHIPVFARTDPTDMYRDWSQPRYVADKDKYSATITLASNVIPVYAWYNGTTLAQLPGEPLQRMADGKTVGMMVPRGDRNDPGARIAPFKLHKARIPVLKDKGWILPIAVEEFFSDGDLGKAIVEGAHSMYGVEDAQIEWADSIRYMGIYHGIPKAKQSTLECLDCHAPGARMDWKALGYDGDPLDAALAR